jgi:hypothetical protein
MDDASAQVVGLIFGRWRSQILHAGVKLGVFDALAQGRRTSQDAASTLHADAGLLYRLMRALACIGLLQEDTDRVFSLTPTGDVLRTDHPHTLRAMALLEEGPESYAAWKHLPALIKEGRQDGFVREFGQPVFDYAAQHPDYAAVFNDAMSSYSSLDNMILLEAVGTDVFSGISHLCDVGGGHGHTLCTLLASEPSLRGTVLDLPGVVEQTELLWANKLGVADRCTYAAGDMFCEVPAADAYMVKRVLHDWDDEECLQILSTMQQAAPKGGRVLIVEQIVPGPETPHFSKLFDIHMLIALTGRERTHKEYADLLEGAGWSYRQTWYPTSKMIGVVEGIKA